MAESANRAMNKLEKTIVAIVEMFEDCASTDSHKQLSNAELSALVMCQLRSPAFQNTIDQEDICDALQKIDKDHDGQIKFFEVCQSVAILAQGYVKYGENKGKVHH